ncbi:1986_t:CDS:10 [Ambispora gerdemannii]|uniref:Arginyl-tRNA--protein transferase 1 n=1 Tax=Ambispora gerdemannii TaxID=144530 RepID=A0A9N8V4J2_9GLOM|nr:1986_t:CDS:10 [Ambispora gerdemannii]
MAMTFVYSTGFHSSSCGYCKGSSSSHSFGIQADKMTCRDYQDFIDRGWRRSGHYTYKPNLRDSCCPQYTIRHFSYVLKLNCLFDFTVFSKYHLIFKDPDLIALLLYRLNVLQFQASKSQRKIISKFNHYIEGLFVPSIEEGKGSELIAIHKEDPQLNTNVKSKKTNKNASTFELSEAIHEYEEKHDWKHRFRIILEKSSFTTEKFQLYKKYQVNIHKDEPSRLTEYGFKGFLVNSPLIFEPPSRPNTPGYGSFHQLYYLDDKLIAIAVLDILPKCVSSVYFIYDPDYSFLGLGNYSALREISFTKELHDAGCTELEWYYMGFYIHSCQKMRYKSQYQPSELLDPETYDWYPFEKCAPLLDKQKYVAFSNSKFERMLDPENLTFQDLRKIRVSINGRIKNVESISGIQNNEYALEMLKEYVAAVGKDLAARIVLQF